MNRAETDSDVIESRPLVDLVRERLIADIMEHRYRPAQKLPVAEVACRYGVSETPVKQAFSRLVSEGLLDALPRRGVVIRRPSRQNVLELMEARQMLNLATIDAAIAAYRADGSFRDELARNLAAHELLLPVVYDTLEVDTFLRYISIDTDFHHIYVRCLGSSIIERQFEQFHNQARIFISLSRLVAERVRSALVDHRAMVAATAAGDPVALLDAMINHKNNALRMMSALLSEEEDQE